MCFNKLCYNKFVIGFVLYVSCGKTTVCQLHSATHDQTLYSVNCHLHTEASDFLGGLRPVRTHQVHTFVTSKKNSTESFGCGS